MSDIGFCNCEGPDLVATDMRRCCVRCGKEWDEHFSRPEIIKSKATDPVPSTKVKAVIRSIPEANRDLALMRTDLMRLEIVSTALNHVPCTDQQVLAFCASTYGPGKLDNFTHWRECVAKHMEKIRDHMSEIERWIEKKKSKAPRRDPKLMSRAHRKIDGLE
jgi:hypothetical protein